MATPITGRTTPDFTETSLAEHAIGYNTVLPGEAREPLAHVQARAMMD